MSLEDDIARRIAAHAGPALVDCLLGAALERLLTPAEAARYLGVSQTTLRGLELPVCRPVPTSPRYRLSDLNTYIRKKTA